MWKNNKKNKNDGEPVDKTTTENQNKADHVNDDLNNNNHHNKESSKQTDQNETKKEQEKTKEPVKDNLAVENTELKKQIDELKKQLQHSEFQLKKQQDEFVEKLKQKAKEAQSLVDQKQKELDDKFAEELEHKKSKIYKSEMIGIIDALEQFDKIVNNPVDDPKLANYLMGFKMILTMFENALSNMHISKVQVKVGDELDPNLMDAFEVVEVDGFKHNQVVEVIRDAYKYKDTVIKHAVVKVQK